jgi:hypothetical protein
VKKSLRKLNLSRETLHTLEIVSPSAGFLRPFSGTGHSCPEVCNPLCG